MKKQTIFLVMLYKVSVAIILISTVFLSSCGKKTDIVIASKNYTENIILADIMKVLIQEKTDLSIEAKLNFGTSFVIYQALKSGDIDIYPDYTGTLYQAKLKYTEPVSAEESFRIVKKELLKQFNWIVFDQFGFNNTYAIGLLEERAKELEISKISDLRKYPALIAGFDSEFVARADGAVSMFEFYDIQPTNNILSLEIGLRYQAIIEKKADYTDVFSTDSKLKRFNMIILEDDKHFFPSYSAIPVVRKEIIDKYPELISVLALLANSIDEETMIDLNYQLEEDKKDSEDIAQSFLQDRGLI